MRVTNNIIFNNINKGTSSQINAVSELYKRSQYKIIKSSDNPVDQSEILRIESKLNDIKNKQKTNQSLSTKLKEVDSTLTSYNKSFDKLNELIIKSASGSKSKDDLEELSHIIGKEIDGIVSILNKKGANDNYIFSGDLEKDKPFIKVNREIEIGGELVEVEVYEYQGGDTAKNVEVEKGDKVNENIVGSDLIDSNGFNIFEMAAVAKHYLSQGVPIPDDDFIDIEEGLSELLSVFIKKSSDVGNDADNLEKNESIYKNMHSNYRESLSKVKDADYLEVVTEMTKHEQILKSVAAASKVILEMSNTRII